MFRACDQLGHVTYIENLGGNRNGYNMKTKLNKEIDMVLTLVSTHTKLDLTMRTSVDRKWLKSQADSC